MYNQIRKISFIPTLICLIFTQRAASQPIFSIGPKLGYIFGEQGGLTGGFELSYFRQQEFPQLGFTFDLTFWKNHTSLHLGVEEAGAVGIDVGPTLFYSKGVINVGLSAIPWIGLLFLFPYYEFAWPFGEAPFNTVGGYIKFPVGYQFRGFG